MRTFFGCTTLGLKTGNTLAGLITSSPLAYGLDSGHEFPCGSLVAMPSGIENHSQSKIKSIVFHLADLVIVGRPSVFGQILIFHAENLPPEPRLLPNTIAIASNSDSPLPATRSKSQGGYHLPWISHRLCPSTLTHFLDGVYFL